MTSRVKQHHVPLSQRAIAFRLLAMADEHKVRVGARIREAREAKGWTQRELAQALPGRVDGPSVSRWERGGVLPQLDTLRAIADALETTVAAFHEDDGQPEAGVASTPGLL